MSQVDMARVREVMATFGVSQADLAREARASRQEVHRWVTGKRRPTTDNLLRLWWALDRIIKGD